MDGHRAPIIAVMGFLALIIIHWAALPGAAERPPPPESWAGRADSALGGSYAVPFYGQACQGMNQNAGLSTVTPFSAHAPAVGKAPGGIEEALPGVTVLQNRGPDALSGGAVLTGRNNGSGPRTRMPFPGTMTTARVREAGPADRSLLVSGLIPAAAQACPAGAMPSAEGGLASKDRGLD